jgi:hypothetical protein
VVESAFILRLKSRCSLSRLYIHTRLHRGPSRTIGSPDVEKAEKPFEALSVLCVSVRYHEIR